MKNIIGNLRFFPAFIILILVVIACSSCQKNFIKEKPNVILIVTDDQGYGDFGISGNPIIATPNLDAMARRSAQMTNYYVSPVCAPTRASLMTGRYNYRTRVVDTFWGRAMMDTEEVTIAEILKTAGYSTGIFGKWHLGDNYPMRPQDQGFEEVLVHRGGGIGQESDPPGGEGKYTDPVLFHNGSQIREKGYCTDIYFERAIQWMKGVRQKEKPFFIYLATNAPHSPVNDVPEKLYQKYKAMNLADDQFPQTNGHPLSTKDDLDRRARIYAMITNIDDNIGRLFRELEQQGLTENTLIIFMVDNGPNGQRFVAGMRGNKTTVYEGGIKSPLFIHWPARLNQEMRSDEVVAHIDILPTILDACNIIAPAGLRFDGRSFFQLLTGKQNEWPDRPVVLQAHRGDRPVAYNNFALRTRQWKLLNANGFHQEQAEDEPRFELYQMIDDPLEMHDLAEAQPEVVNQLRAQYDRWFHDVSNTRPDNYTPPRIPVGSLYENPVVLTRQDWRRISENPWLDAATGFWRLDVVQPGEYTVLVRFRDKENGGLAMLTIGDKSYQQILPSGHVEILFKNIEIKTGPTDLQAWLEMSGDRKSGSWQVEVRALNVR
jgi:arylsulfatase/arylsulfatase A